MSLHIRLPSALKFNPNKGCSYPKTLLNFIIIQLACCLAVIIHVGRQWELIAARDANIGPTTLVPFIIYSSCLLFVIYVFFFYLHYRGKLVPDYFTLITLLTANAIHCASVYVGFRPRPDLKLALNESRNVFGLETSKVFFDPVVGGVHSVGILLNILILTLWFVGRRIRAEKRKSMKLQAAQRASCGERPLHQSLAQSVFTPEQLQALRELHTSGELDRDLDLEAGKGRSMSISGNCKRESRISATHGGITVVTFERGDSRSDRQERGHAMSPGSIGGSTLASPISAVSGVSPTDMEKVYLGIGGRL